MKATKKQIEQIKAIKPYSTTRFHGNKKQVGTLPIKEYLNIVEIKMQREKLKHSERPSNIQLIKQLIKDSVNYVGTPYRKIKATQESTLHRLLISIKTTTRPDYLTRTRLL
mgnify:CR=1 FL=1